jgi:hypothetical protein
MDDKTRIELEAAAFRRLVAHLRERTDVQNIDLMNLAGFCRNCLSKWYRAEAVERGIDLSDPAAREIVYGESYESWKAKHQAGDGIPALKELVQSKGGGHKH